MTGQDLVREIRELNDVVHVLADEKLSPQGIGELSNLFTGEKIRHLEEALRFLKEIINELTLPPGK